MPSVDYQRKRPALGVAALILLALLPASHLAAPSQGSSMGALPLSASPAASRAASMGMASLAGAPEQAPPPNYDEQIGVTFTQDFSSLTFNVTAVAQTDANGYGPGYLMNGLTALGYWYQVGISYDWPLSEGGYLPGFGFSYEVFSPNGKSVYPLGGGAGLGNFSGAVHSGDSVLLSLNFTGSSVEMLAQDWSTGASANANYSSNGSTAFVGQTSNAGNPRGFFTGLMTEWYHVSMYSGNEQEVTYTDDAVTLTSAWMWIDEFDTATPSSPLFVDQTSAPISLVSGQLYPYTAGGATSYISAHEFITGMLPLTSPSRITLSPATAGTSSINFSAAYTLAGEHQTTTIAAGTTVIEADPGSSITISTNSSGTGGLERWVFNGTSGTQVTFEAGTNATFVYYQIVEETVSYQVVGGGQLPTSQSPELVYLAPPAAASGTPNLVGATQLLATSPTGIFAVSGTSASLANPITGATGERWAGPSQAWAVSAPNGIPEPIPLYHQYEILASYSVAGGGTPPLLPEITGSYLGTLSNASMSLSQTSYWLDAGSGYNCTGVINGSSSTERWLGASTVGTVATPGESVSVPYTHQFLAFLGSNDASGGFVSYPGAPLGPLGPSSPSVVVPSKVEVWFSAGSTTVLSASANQRWQFESWTGSGTGAYNGTNPSISITVAGPFTENATFYVQLAIAAGSGANVAYSYPSGTGTVRAGTTKTLYIPPSSDVTLKATPSLFVYSFSSWQGTSLANATKPSVALVVDSPTKVTGMSSYNYPVVLGLTALVVLLLFSASLWIRRRRRRGWVY